MSLTSRTICGSSVVSTAMSGVRDRMRLSRSCNGLSVVEIPVRPRLIVGRIALMLGHNSRGSRATFKEKLPLPRRRRMAVDSF